MSRAGAEGPWALPEGWCWARLGEAADVIAGQSPPSETYNNSGVGLPFFQGKTEFGELYPTVRKWCDSPTKIAEAGDILISVRAPVGPTNVASVRSGIGRGLAAVRAARFVEPRWLLNFLRFSEQKLAALGTGTTFAAITGDVLRDHVIPLAPLHEQRRIVARIDALFAEIAEGEAALAAARKGLEHVPPRAAQGRRVRRTDEGLARGELSKGKWPRPPRAHRKGSRRERRRQGTRSA